MNGGGPIRLTFDAARCDGWGMCTVVFPEGISLDPWGFAQVTDEAITDPRLRRKALRAAACCPRRAIGVAVERPEPAAPTTATGRQQPQ